MPSFSKDRDAFKAISSACGGTTAEADSNRDKDPGTTWARLGATSWRVVDAPNPARCSCRVCLTLKVSLLKIGRFWRQKPRAETMRLTHVPFQRFLRNVATTKKIIYPPFSARRCGNSDQHAKKKKKKKGPELIIRSEVVSFFTCFQ